MNERLLGIVTDSFTKLLIPGLTMTIPLTAISFTCAMIIAVICATIRHARVPVLDQIVKFYVWVIRGTPLLVQLFIMYYGLPNLGIVIKAFPCAVLVFSLNEGAYCEETLRGSLEGVETGQYEAGRSLGLSYMQIMSRIIWPQALRTAFPSLSNNLISMVKDTSLAANITVMEMFMVAQRIAGRYFEYMALYIEVALIYLLFCTVLNKLQAVCEKKLSKYSI